MTGARVLGGRYALQDVLGTGGMAAVWRAHDQVLGRQVAVKVLGQQYAADPGFLARFEREARHAASVSHPRLVTVFDSGIDRGMPFLVMELVSGRTLRQVLGEAGPLPLAQAVAVAAAVCEGLEAAHAAGLVHRDIKPANIMLADEEVKILDFGITRADGTAGTMTGTVLGTVAYLSPEQAAGHAAGPQSDLYSLGCVLFEMLTGSPPFTAESRLALACQQVYDQPGPPSARRPGLPASLDQITASLLAKDPVARPVSAAAARAELLAALAPGSTAALPAMPVGDVPGPPGVRHRLRWTEIVLGAGLAVALAALAAVLLTRPGSTRLAASAARTPASHAATPAASPAPTRPAASHAPSRAPSRAPTRPAASHAPSRAPTRPAASPRPTAARSTPAKKTAGTALPPAAAAAAALVGDLKAGVTDGQVTQQAGQDLFSHLQPLLFPPAGQNAQQIHDQYTQLVNTYQQHHTKGDITGHAAAALPGAIAALGTALGAG
ncbi:MAG TPA: protein kinase [Streptosporangiaceae bacterium]